MVMQWHEKYAPHIIIVLLIVIILTGIYFTMQKPITIVVDGQRIHKKVFFSTTVGQLLNKENIALNEHDVVVPSLDSVVKKKTEIIIEHAFPIYIKADGQVHEIMTTTVTTQAALALAGLGLNETDILSADLSDYITPYQEINIIRVTEATIEEQQVVAYYVERTEDESLERGLSKTVRPGINGLALNRVKVTYHDNVEVKRELLDSKVVREPVNQVVAMGNITSVSRSGVRMDFHEAKYMEATAYTYTGKNTASGQPPAVGLIAVDPRVIPLGTKLYVEGYGYAIAADTGGNIKGDRVDIFFEDRNECLKWGRRTVKVYILH